CSGWCGVCLHVCFFGRRRGLVCSLVVLRAGSGSRTRRFSDDLFLDLAVACRVLCGISVTGVALSLTFLAARTMALATRAAVLCFGTTLRLVCLHIRFVVLCRLVFFLAIRASFAIVVVATTVASAALTTLATFAAFATLSALRLF